MHKLCQQRLNANQAVVLESGKQPLINQGQWVTGYCSNKVREVPHRLLLRRGPTHFSIANTFFLCGG